MFDGAYSDDPGIRATADPVLRALKEGRDKVARGWCQRQFHQPAQKRWFGLWTDPDRYCIAGAMGTHYNGEWPSGAQGQALRYLAHILGFREIERLPRWNDGRDRTQADVVRAYDRAIALRTALGPTYAARMIA